MNGQGEDLARGDNKNLLDLLIIVLKYKGLIISCLLLIYLFTFTYFYFSAQRTHPPASPAKPVEIYHSESVIWLPGYLHLIDYNKMKVQIMSRSTLLALGKFFNLSAICMGEWNDERNNHWRPTHLYLLDKRTQEWVSAETSDVQNLSEVAALFIKSQNNLVTLRFHSTNPEVPQRALIFCLEYISEFMRKPVLEYYESQKQIFHKQLANAQDPVLKGRLFEQYSNLIDKETRAKQSKYFGIEIVELPFLPEKIFASEGALHSASRKRNYIAIVALMTLVSFIISILLAYLIEYVKNMKRNDPERFDLIRKHARFRK